jgi:hypothetical protein
MSGKGLTNVRPVVTFCRWDLSSQLQLAPCPAPLAPRETRPVVRRNLLRPASGAALLARQMANTSIDGYQAGQPGAQVNPRRHHLVLTTSPFGLVDILARDARQFRLGKARQSLTGKQRASWLSWSFSGHLARKSRWVSHCYGALLLWRGDR